MEEAARNAKTVEDLEKIKHAKTKSLEYKFPMFSIEEFFENRYYDPEVLPLKANGKYTDKKAELWLW